MDAGLHSIDREVSTGQRCFDILCRLHLCCEACCPAKPDGTRGSCKSAMLSFADLFAVAQKGSGRRQSHCYCVMPLASTGGTGTDNVPSAIVDGCVADHSYHSQKLSHASLRIQSRRSSWIDNPIAGASMALQNSRVVTDESPKTRTLGVKAERMC